jgi:hypothetical protein
MFKAIRLLGKKPLAVLEDPACEIGPLAGAFRCCAACEFALKGPQQFSPGQRPGCTGCRRKRRCPERAKHSSCGALSGLEVRFVHAFSPGRCPGVVCGCPFGTPDRATSKLALRA